MNTMIVCLVYVTYENCIYLKMIFDVLENVLIFLVNSLRHIFSKGKMFHLTQRKSFFANLGIIEYN